MFCQLLVTMWILYLYNPVELFKTSRGVFKEWVSSNVPNLQPDYNPNHGYEPYWPGGNWLYMEKELKPGETTTAVPLVCGEECSYLYRRVGKVCGRKVGNIEYQRHEVKWFWHAWYDEFYRGFYTFESYCDFLDHQCRSTSYNDRWFLVHEGACSHTIESYYKPLTGNHGGPKERLPSYLDKLGKKFQNAGLDSPLRQKIGVSLPVGNDTPISLDDDISRVLAAGDQLYPGTDQHLSEGPLRYTLPYTIKQYIHNFVRDTFLKSDETSNK